MNKNSKYRARYVHLYDPKKEGIGKYDVNYINAHEKNKRTKESQIKDYKGRYAA